MIQNLNHDYDMNKHITYMLPFPWHPNVQHSGLLHHLKKSLLNHVNKPVRKATSLFSNVMLEL